MDSHRPPPLRLLQTPARPARPAQRPLPPARWWMRWLGWGPMRQR